MQNAQELFFDFDNIIADHSALSRVRSQLTSNKILESNYVEIFEMESRAH